MLSRYYRKPDSKTTGCQIKKTEQVIPIFVISLPRSIERRVAIAEHLSSLELSYEIVDAVDGMKLPESERSMLLAPGRNYHPGVVGCYISHIDVYRIIMKRKLPMALILEDDARLKKEFAASLCRNLSWNAFDFLLLDSAGHTEDQPAFIDLNSRRHVVDVFYCYKPHIPPAGLHAYIISFEGARRRLECAFPIEAPIDVHTRLPYSPDVRVIFNPTAAGLSELGQHSSTSHRRGGSKVRFRALKRHRAYRALRDAIKFARLREIYRRRELILAGVLAPDGRWRQLPEREWIL